MKLEVSSQAAGSRKRGGQFKRESVCEISECLEPDQHSAGDNVNEDHMRMRGSSCQVEFGKSGNIADGIELIQEGNSQLRRIFHKINMVKFNCDR
jgi:hypothetical protein